MSDAGMRVAYIIRCDAQMKFEFTRAVATRRLGLDEICPQDRCATRRDSDRKVRFELSDQERAWEISWRLRLRLRKGARSGKKWHKRATVKLKVLGSIRRRWG